MAFFYDREENEKEIKIVFKTTPWQWYINVFFLLLISTIRFGAAYKQSQNLQERIIDEKLIIFILILVAIWLLIGLTFTLGNRKAVKEVNHAVALGKKVHSTGSPWSAKNPRVITILK